MYLICKRYFFNAVMVLSKDKWLRMQKYEASNICLWRTHWTLFVFSTFLNWGLSHIHDMILTSKKKWWTGAMWNLYSLVSERASTGAEGWAGVVWQNKVTVLSKKVAVVCFMARCQIWSLIKSVTSWNWLWSEILLVLLRYKTNLWGILLCSGFWSVRIHFIKFYFLWNCKGYKPLNNTELPISKTRAVFLYLYFFNAELLGKGMYLWMKPL